MQLYETILKLYTRKRKDICCFCSDTFRRPEQRKFSGTQSAKIQIGSINRQMKVADYKIISEFGLS